jgi:hypothetical protein
MGRVQTGAKPSPRKESDEPSRIAKVTRKREAANPTGSHKDRMSPFRQNRPSAPRFLCGTGALPRQLVIIGITTVVFGPDHCSRLA